MIGPVRTLAVLDDDGTPFLHYATCDLCGWHGFSFDAGVMVLEASAHVEHDHPLEEVD